MKIYQALKEKNKLAGEIKELEQLLQAKNSLSDTEENLFDIKQMFNELSEKRKALVDLKTKLTKANQPIQKLIYELAELKSEAAFYNRLNTKAGTFNLNSYGSPNNVKYVVTLNELDVANKKKELKNSIDKIQEQLDHYNHTTDVD